MAIALLWFAIALAAGVRGAEESMATSLALNGRSVLRGAWHILICSAYESASGLHPCLVSLCRLCPKCS